MGQPKDKATTPSFSRGTAPSKPPPATRPHDTGGSSSEYAVAFVRRPPPPDIARNAFQSDGRDLARAAADSTRIPFRLGEKKNGAGGGDHERLAVDTAGDGGGKGENGWPRIASSTRHRWIQQVCTRVRVKKVSVKAHLDSSSLFAYQTYQVHTDDDAYMLVCQRIMLP